MSQELKDFRGKITPETDRVIEARSRALNIDRSEVVRNVLHTWAMAQIHEASLMHHLLRAEGLVGIAEGIAGRERDSAGHRRESQGMRGNGS